MTEHLDIAPTPPVHVAIIMDGNGRWAEHRGKRRVAGHREGAEAVRRTIEAAGKLGVSYLTLFSFSSENWRRPEEEVSDLMGLLRRYLKSEIADLHSKNVRFRVIGERDRLADDIQRLVEDAERLTAGNDGLALTLALSYGGRAEIVEAARRLAEQARRGDVNPADIDESLFENNLWSAGLPDPDLLIRTSGEKRISNFLLWQCAYTEFVFTDVLWPDFDEQAFLDAVAEYQRRDRRFGATVSYA
ncbi:isoprenyl transferase [Rhodospirillaceae bacterium KN72]|uniref:Isoprenyl transferase n=1 Tax=Pacificispira spongiicola TaxID=2729598 RepID=A0A7Y0HG68_9PROT|nr:isoprenyl transferase [Pacificispira spongiicola]NMM44034.1 isoprenyl transferase [Pacificispira spongiicola]